jgi:hypothetical protein
LKCDGNLSQSEVLWFKENLFTTKCVHATHAGL